MTKKPRRPATEDSSPITVLRGIQQGSLSPKSLPRETRLTCVEHLTGEGYTASEIAEILEISTRTAFRDLGRIREANALERDPQVVKEMVGQAVLHARLAVARLRRIGRDRSTHASAQVEAELGAWRVTKELTELLQRLGILPLAAQEIRADPPRPRGPDRRGASPEFRQAQVGLGCRRRACGVRGCLRRGRRAPRQGGGE